MSIAFLRQARVPEPKRLREDRMIREERWADIHHAGPGTPTARRCRSIEAAST
jgi:hypothetical protein